MTCSSCGAEVSALDTTCRACGAELRTPMRVAFGAAIGDAASDGERMRTDEVSSPSLAPASPPTPATPPAPTIGTSTAPARKRANRFTKVLAIVTGLVILVGIGACVSLTQLTSKLSRSEAEAASRSSQLTAATDQADSLQQRLGDLEVASQQLESKLDDAQGQVSDTKKSLTACQEVFRMAAKYPNPAQVPPSVAVQIASKLVSCFQGEVPPSLYG
jgi:hypothetical protein